MKIIDSNRINIQLYAPVSKKVKYGLSKFAKWLVSEDPDVFLEQIIELETLVADFGNLNKGKIPQSILESLDENPTINWKIKH